jgi:hypothetical protein
VLYALARPAAFAGLVLAFLIALLARAFAIRVAARTLNLTDRRESVGPRLREDVDAFGAVAAAVGGAGWGKIIDVDEVPRSRGRGRAAAVFLAGPVLCLLVAQAFFLAFVLIFPDAYHLSVFRPSDILRGQFEGDIGEEFLLTIPVGLLCFGLLALIPMPPLDGFGVLWSAVRRPGQGLQGYRLWFQEKNLGVVILLACCFFPLDHPLLLLPLDLLGTPILRLWA